MNLERNVKKELGVKKEEVSKVDQLSIDVKELNIKEEVSKDGKANGRRPQAFTLEEMEVATRNFSPDCFIGEGGFGKVYKGHLEKTNQVCCVYLNVKFYHLYNLSCQSQL